MPPFALKFTDQAHIPIQASSNTKKKLKNSQITNLYHKTQCDSIYHLMVPLLTSVNHNTNKALSIGAKWYYVVLEGVEWYKIVLGGNICY